MRSSLEVSRVLALVAEGLNDCEIARRTGVPRSTVRGWRHGERVFLGPAVGACAGCGNAEHDFTALPEWHYAYLLGLYLGDGHIAHHRRGVYALRISLDKKYPGIIDECRVAIWWVTGGKDPALVSLPGRFNVQAYWKSLPCLFPQHGPGDKHERRIELVEWQREIVEREPGALLRGLIHSDGWRGTNRVTVKGKEYRYPRYQFCNVSDDIRGIFCWACDLLEIAWRRMNARNISVAKRDAVARLDELVGPKR
ncbi:MAG TPA: helix-turn-helix domain-containing protein [Solirubrobacteraceae bacterium]|nr:helix-turn-helix domain-containing protein [Solirubrobacteraceae bacterium]